MELWSLSIRALFGKPNWPRNKIDRRTFRFGKSRWIEGIAVNMGTIQGKQKNRFTIQ